MSLECAVSLSGNKFSNRGIIFLSQHFIWTALNTDYFTGWEMWWQTFYLANIISGMKTPEHWWPSRVVPSLSIFLPKDIKWHHDVTPWRHNYDMTKWTCTGQSIWISENHIFQSSELELWAMTLSFKPIQDVVKVNLSTTFWVRTSNDSA